MVILSVRSDQSYAQSSTLHAMHSPRFILVRDISDREIEKINYFEQKKGEALHAHGTFSLVWNDYFDR
jgi:hypothetical protein